MDVVFPVMPFADAGRPSMGVSLLAAITRAAGYSVETIYFNLDLAAEMGLGTYQRVASGFPPNILLGERLFADDLFGPEIAEMQDYLADIYMPLGGNDSAFFDEIAAMGRMRSRYLDACAAEIMARRPHVVGFSTVFHQTCACLSVARRLKAERDPPIIVFGGANCEGEMGLQMIRSFPWIDFVCSGESDLSFLRLLDRLSAKAPDRPVPGVLERGAAEGPVRSAAVRDLDALPYPEFEGYFERLAGSRLAGQFESHLVFETSRGCWWGAKHHCTFCGLNGDTMTFRSKSPGRAFDEIVYLTRRYGTERIGCVDNILDMKYVDTLFPRLAEAGLDLNLFYEVKSNLRYDQLVRMRRGGVRQIQPGIESFADSVLKLMEKGCTGLQNIQLMRWCRELGIEVAWNILAGFPGEAPEDYRVMAGLIPRLSHLDPPCSVGMVRLDRFSPFHNRAQAFGFIRLRPSRAYFYVFPLGRRELARLAYFFDYDYADGRKPQEYVTPIQAAAQAWVGSHATPEAAPRLDAEIDPDRVVIHDTRPVAIAGRHVLEGLAARLYARCDTIASLAGLARELQAPETEVASLLADLDDRRLIARAGDRVLSLAVFRRRLAAGAAPSPPIRDVIFSEPAAA